MCNPHTMFVELPRFGGRLPAWDWKLGEASTGPMPADLLGVVSPGRPAFKSREELENLGPLRMTCWT